MKTLILAVMLITSLLIGQTALEACTPAQAAVLSHIEQVVLNDLTAGKTASQIEADVAVLLAGQPGADVVMIVNDAIALLIDLGVIPPGVIPQAMAVHAEMKAKLAARPATTVTVTKTDGGK